jgi:hypothetical protein
MDGNWIPTKADGVIEAVVDGDRVLMSPKQFDYFGFAETGTEVWNLIDGKRTMDDIVATLHPQFDADPEQIRVDVVDFIAALEQAGLLASDM